MIAVDGGLEGLNHAEKPVDQRVMEAMMLVSDERDHVQMTVGFRPAMELEHLRSQDTACIVADALPAEIERLKHRRDSVVDFRDGAEIVRTLTHLGRAARLREFPQKAQSVTISAVIPREEVVQHIAYGWGEMCGHHIHEKALSVRHLLTDEVGQASNTWNLKPLLNQKIDAAAEDHAGFQMRPHHRGDLGDEACLCRCIEGPKSLKTEDQPPMPQTRGLLVGRSFKVLWSQAAHPRDIGDVARMKVFWRKEPPGGAKVAIGQKKADPACGTAHALRGLQYRPGEIEMSFAFSTVEDGRLLKTRLIGGAEDAHAGHGVNPG